MICFCFTLVALLLAGLIACIAVVLALCIVAGLLWFDWLVDIYGIVI